MSTARLSLAPSFLLGLFALIALVAVPQVSRADLLGFDPDAIYQVPLGDGPRRGSDRAPVTIVVWSDFTCGYCERVRATTEQVDRLYPGKVRWVFRHMPLDDEWTLGAEASLAAAAQGRFWPMHDRLFAVRGQVDRAGVELIASELGLDLGRFRADLDTGAYRKAVAIDVEAARHLGISSTPAFFVNGRPLRGNQPLQVFVAAVDQELARAGEALAKGVAPAALYQHLVADGRPHADAPADARPPFAELDRDQSYRVGLGLPGHIDGPADALVTVIAWSDFECPYCVRSAPLLARLRTEYGDRVRIVFRHMPLPFHHQAPLAAEAAVAAGAQGKFWPMHDRIFGDPKNLGRAALEAHAQAIGLDLARFRAALDERRYREAVNADAAAGSILGVQGTPALFVNGTVIPGAPPWAHLKNIVDARLREAEQLVATGVARGDVYGLVVLRAARAERGDPSRMPASATAGPIELGQVDREAAIQAACRGREAARARGLASRLAAPRRAAAAGACEAYGIDIE